MRNTELIKNLILVVTATAASLLACEAALRAADYPPSDFSPWAESQETGFKFAANLHHRMVAPEYDVLFETNSFGLRDDEIGPKRTRRILLLGDSFTCGQGVHRDELFADLLEKRLGVSVVNAGVSGFQIIHQYNYFRTHGKLFQPDLVVYALYLGNDLSRNGEWKLDEKGNLVGERRSWPVRVARETKLIAMLKWLKYSLQLHWVHGKREWKPPEDYLAMCREELDETARRNYEVSKKLLRMLRDEVVASGSEFFVVMFSYRTAIEPQAALTLRSEIEDLDRMYDLDRPAREIGRFLADIGVEFVCLNDEMREHYASDTAPLFYYCDGHFTKLGHQFVADALYPVLIQKLEVRHG